MGGSMMRRLLTGALLFPSGLLACGGTGDIPAPGCQSIQLSNVVSFADTPAGDAFALQCLPHPPTVDAANGSASCAAFYARATTEPCDCAAADGFKAVSAAHKAGVDQLLGSLSKGCVCEIEQLTGTNRKACVTDGQNPHDAAGNEISGYCYVNGGDSSVNPQLVESCATNERRALRFLGRSAIRASGDLGIAYLCETDVCADPGE